MRGNAALRASIGEEQAIKSAYDGRHHERAVRKRPAPTEATTKRERDWTSSSRTCIYSSVHRQALE